MDITLAKVMFYDKKDIALTVSTDDIRYLPRTLRDKVVFIDDEDFDKNHTYWVKWTDCPPQCEEDHVHSSYYPARILCLSANLSDLNRKSFRFPKIPFEDETLSPMASQSTLSEKSCDDHFLDDVEENSDMQGSESDEDGQTDEEHLTKKQLLAQAKKNIQLRNSLDTLAELKEKNANRKRKAFSETNGRNFSASTEPFNEAADSNCDDTMSAENLNIEGNNVSRKRTFVPASNTHNQENPNNRAVAQRMFKRQQSRDNTPLPPDPQRIVRQQQVAVGQSQQSLPDHRECRNHNTENLPVPRVRRIRYDIINGHYDVHPNLQIDVETYDVMRQRPYKDKNLFRRDVMGLLWTDQELARRYLNIKKVRKKVPGLCPATPEKITLINTVCCNWFEDEKGIPMNQKKRDLHLKQVRSALTRVIRDKREIVFPELIQREKAVDDNIVRAGDQEDGQQEEEGA